MNSLYYCPSCHYIYPASTARDKAFCIDCGQQGTRPATEEEKSQYKADRESVLSLAERKH